MVGLRRLASQALLVRSFRAPFFESATSKPFPARFLEKIGVIAIYSTTVLICI
jgi:hypothetical protein